jgi:hypothetical protein
MPVRYGFLDENCDVLRAGLTEEGWCARRYRPHTAHSGSPPPPAKALLVILLPFPVRPKGVL